tara:strand:- start:3648 stop:5066 length:1419 start_codon:yes stop_codon:yes gene_type:complete
MLENKSVKEIISNLHSGKYKVKEVVKFYLDRIQAYNPSLNAIVSKKNDDEIIKQAEKYDLDSLKKKPLAGLPFASKDLLDVNGFPTTYGFPGYKNYYPNKNSLIVDRLIDAGAIIIGKTNTAELGIGGHTTNRLFGETSNAYNFSKSSGGSSGGAGAAVAANLLPFADGTDMMGSCRTPSAFANIYGFRPTPGLIPDYRTNPNKDNLPILSTPGCLARTPNDLSIILDVVSGKHKSDPHSFSLKQKFEETTIKDEDFSNIKIGWLSNMDNNYKFEQGILEICEERLKSLEKYKIKIENLLSKINPNYLWESWCILRSKSIYEDVVSMKLEDINEMTTQAIWEYNKGIELNDINIKSALKLREGCKDEANKIFQNYDFLALPSQQVFPFDKNIQYPNHINNEKLDTYHRWIEVHILSSLLHLPTINIPIGFNKDGLPIGMQIIGKKYEDLKVLAFAKKYEEIFEQSKTKPKLN